jgi:uncharacterized protein (UPF0332 family)
MRRIPFLNRIHKEGKLRLVDPSPEIKDAYLQRADESLSSAKLLLDVGNLKDAVALAYYAMYHTLLALLFQTGIKCENHAAAIILLKEVFGIDSSSISRAKAERVDKQYYVDFEVTKEEVKEAVSSAENFNQLLFDLTEKLSVSKIAEYKQKAKEIIGIR